ncbi:MAG: type II toxin-antitoxin system HicB family antitoxin [Anaerolineaceae bacterium]|nr:type II toxin-antitoxin system HicB family antitoxin [Anaerolineaceae bacterium]MCY3935447.1 type II toxin-antitoxin system HicB family antitoxin [Chloroflexota bacterium]MCY4009125.1 type II toxin-antitoxin system HicB family antitoxin [Anaerolineaceae bacterium]MCY4106182.1 type II toxin-antitoxin system HicB family antitoxin [Chloroflexota bacterium]
MPFEVSLEGGYYISSCPPLDVLSQGDTEQEAIDNLEEALGLFLEGCYENGTLETVLKESGFREVISGPPEIGMPLLDVPIYLAAHA